MQDILPGRTARETRLSADRGRTAALAVGQQLYARHLYDYAADDMKLLGLTAIPEPRPQTWPVTGGTDDERIARVDAWAAAHHIKAGTDEASGTYRAVLEFGPVKVIAYMIPDLALADRVAAIHKAVAEREAAA